MPKAMSEDSTCSVARSLGVVGDRWALLIIRDALIIGSTRFQEFRDGLGIASNILAKRLALLVEEGLMERRTYQESGVRSHDEYVLTEAGRSLSLVIGALAVWGRTHRPKSDGTSPRFTVDESGLTARLAFVTSDGQEVAPERLSAVRTADAIDHRPDDRRVG
ncbi:winged helix-turn-helix transcriptional regulator [Pseudonocardia adelaidensis]|uniref:Helix-turn-helix domain-containing protein n=1 Tax=Pseudonocardia adelaidensis TaxID=648754 RepID=A0ABP9NMQ7_9PSEU